MPSATVRPAALRCSSAQTAAAARPPWSTITACSPLSIWVSTADDRAGATGDPRRSRCHACARTTTRPCGTRRRFRRSPASGRAPRHAAARRPSSRRRRHPGRSRTRAAAIASTRDRSSRVAPGGRSRSQPTRRSRSVTVPPSVRAAIRVRSARSPAIVVSQLQRRRDCGSGQHAEVIQRLLLDRRRPAHRRGRARRACREVGQHVVNGSGRGSVENDADGDRAGGSAFEHAPRHGIRVPVRGRDEQPEVRGGEQLCGECAILVGDGIDIGRVDDGERRRHPLVGEEHEFVDARHRRCIPAAVAWVPGALSTPRTRASPGRMRSDANQSASAGAWTRIGCRVVGRITPTRVVGAPIIALTIVDLPDPVDPPTTASSGASRVRETRTDVVVDLAHRCRGSLTMLGRAVERKLAARRRRGTRAVVRARRSREPGSRTRSQHDGRPRR